MQVRNNRNYERDRKYYGKFYKNRAADAVQRTPCAKGIPWEGELPQ